MQDITTLTSPLTPTKTGSCMGMHTIIYGYIQEPDFWVNPVRKQIVKHNTAVINALSKGDKWPPLSREMFAICNNYKNHPGPNLEYGGRIIHFAANLKYVEEQWEEWKGKFEALLTQLYFWEARVHVQPEYMLAETARWWVNLNKYKIVHDGTLPPAIKPENWEYEPLYLDK